MRARFTLASLLTIAALALAASPAAAQSNFETDGTHIMKIEPLSLGLRPGATMNAQVWFVAAGSTKKPISPVKWSSSNTKVATVGTDGLITGIAAGKAEVTAQVGKKKTSIRVLVK